MTISNYRGTWGNGNTISQKCPKILAYIILVVVIVIDHHLRPTKIEVAAKIVL